MKTNIIFFVRINKLLDIDALFCDELNITWRLVGRSRLPSPTLSTYDQRQCDWYNTKLLLREKKTRNKRMLKKAKHKRNW